MFSPITGFTITEKCQEKFINEKCFNKTLKNNKSVFNVIVFLVQNIARSRKHTFLGYTLVIHISFEFDTLYWYY